MGEQEFGSLPPKQVCVACRIVFNGVLNKEGKTQDPRPCPSCGLTMKRFHHSWRPPRKRNARAWARIASDTIWWERERHLARAVYDWAPNTGRKLAARWASGRTR